MKRLSLISILLAYCAIVATARQPERGYRGFADVSTTLNLDVDISIYGGSGPSDSYIWLGGSTTHGYQFNPYLFVGGGIGYETVIAPRNERPKRILPVFADVRTDLKFNRFTPFADVKLGVNFTRGAGVYFSPTIGYRFNWGRRTAINFGMGITLFGIQMNYYDPIMAPGGGIIGSVVTGHYHGTFVKPTFRLGIEF